MQSKIRRKKMHNIRYNIITVLDFGKVKGGKKGVSQ
jgi:hypothetical protein